MVQTNYGMIQLSKLCKCPCRLASAHQGWHYARCDFLNDEKLGWCLIELEMLEPSFYLEFAKETEVGEACIFVAEIGESKVNKAYIII